MKDLIIEHIGNAEQLENLFRKDEVAFKKAFTEIYDDIAENPLAKSWKARFDYESKEIKTTWLSKTDVIVLILTMIIPVFLIKLPNIFGFNAESTFFFERNAGMIILFGLSIYAIIRNESNRSRNLLITLFAFIIPAIYINLMPFEKDSDSINLAYLHLPLLLWCVYGLVYIDYDLKTIGKRIDFIKYNGDLAIFLAIIGIAGVILTGITIGLFEAIEMDIEDFYYDYIFVSGLVAAPIIATFIIEKFPQITNKIAPIITNIFSPLVLITLLIYLISIIISGKDPYNDREFLLIFNLMLIGVMAIIVFSVTGISHDVKNRYTKFSLFLLAIVTLIIDLVALSAILYRLDEYGFTPNKIAVLGSNMLILVNLVLIILDLFKAIRKKDDISRVELTIARYLPVYTIWTLFMVFVLPWIFDLK